MVKAIPSVNNPGISARLRIAAPILERLRRLPALTALALGLWGITLAVISVRTVLAPHSNTVFQTYEAAGEHWKSGSRIYMTTGGFVYSPSVAALFAPFTFLPEPLSNFAWRTLNLVIFLGAVCWWLRSRLHEGIPLNRTGLVLLLLLPLSIGNLNNGQVNLMVTGLVMMSFLGAWKERWWVAALCAALAVYLKMYPLVVGMLFIVMFPKKFSWRFVSMLLLLGALPFLCQRPAYVLEQYADWWSTRIHDDRHLYSLNVAPRDLWLLLHDLLHVPIGDVGYKLLQAGTGALIALYALTGAWGRRPLHRTLAGVFTLASCWMLLLGPATESATYVLLAPAVILAFVEELERKSPLGLRALLWSALALLLTSLAINSFTHANRDLETMALQPLAAVLFSSYAVIALVRVPAERPSGASVV